MERGPVNSAIEIHDSLLGGIEREAKAIILRLTPAYIHKSPGEPGVDAGEGWVQNARVVLDSPSGDPAVATFPVVLSDGTLTVNGNNFSNMIPLPLNETGTISLKLVTHANENISILASAVHVELLGEPEYVERVQAITLATRENRYLQTRFDEAVASGETPIPFEKAVEQIERERATAPRRSTRKRKRSRNSKKSRR